MTGVDAAAGEAAGSGDIQADGEAQAQAQPVIEPLPAPPRVRRAGDVLKLLVALVVLVGAQLVATLAHVSVRVTEHAFLESIVTLPGALRDWMSALAQVAAVLLPVGFIAALVGGRRFSLSARAVLAAAAGTCAGLVVTHVFLASSHPSSWGDLLVGRGGLFAVKFPPVAWLSGAIAMLTVVAPEVSGRWRHVLWWVVGIGSFIQVFVGGFLPVDAIAAAALGVCIGCVVLLAFGGPTNRPQPEQVAAALQECGIELSRLKEVAAGASGPAIFTATDADGAILTVKVLATEDRDRDLLTRLYRWLLMRDPEDDRAGPTVESAVEHEMLTMVSAARAGARVPDAVVAYPVTGGRGPRGALVAWVEVAGRSLRSVDAQAISGTALADLWDSVAVLQKHKLAHRLLRTDNVIVDEHEQAWLVGLSVAELGATPRQLAIDVAELLVSLSVQVGLDRAVSSAMAGLGAPRLERAAPYIQPLAVSGTTRGRARAFDRARSSQSVRDRAEHVLRPGGRPDLFKDVRAAIATATGTTPARPEQISRFTLKRLVALVGAFVVIYVVLPQLANFGAALRALEDADWWWVLAALPAVFVAEGFATLLQLGAIPAQLPFRPTYTVEFGGAFLNKVTPSGVGGMALSFRYLQKTGIDSGAATGSVGLQAIVSTGAGILLAAAFLSVTDEKTSAHFTLRGHEWVFLLIAGVLIAMALFALTPPGRRIFRQKVWGFLRSAGSTLAAIAKSPRHVCLIIVGGFGWPMVEVVAFAICVHAVGGNLPFVQVAGIYLGGNLVASIAPVPGGLGALEAALVAGLSGLGMPVGAAASAVLIYRLLTFWLTIPVGWVALKLADKRGYV
ncbi:MAG TPA: lysylphosphatidylglycerol synthase transmembrane domain-containing protein [Acidimicrobiales bacterium]|nr:lysylphosphatidylglycerol synthase transmembrane domain-containing protein [Acidimicrobiales bacterium]